MTVSAAVIANLLDRILEREGGYVDHPADRGGPTNFGVTIAALAEWRKKQGLTSTTSEHVKTMNAAEAKAIYRREYMERPGFLAIEDLRLFGLVVDSAVNHGPKMATKMLQQALGVRDDGVMGPVTVGALDAGDFQEIYLRFIAARMKFYGTIVSRDHSQATFILGWLNRLSEFLTTEG